MIIKQFLYILAEQDKLCLYTKKNIIYMENKNKMDILKDMIKETFKEVFNEQKLPVKLDEQKPISKKETEVKMARATMEDGMVLQYDDNFEIGTAVLVIIDNGEDAEETTEPAKEGEYIIPEGTIKVDADGNLLEFVAVEADVVDDEELSKEEVIDEELSIEQIENPNLNVEGLVEILDLNVDGAIELVANIENGVVVSWNVVDVTEMETAKEEMTTNLSKVKEGHIVELSTVKAELKEANDKLTLLAKSAILADPEKEIGKEKETPLTDMEKRKEAMKQSLNKNK